MINSTELKNGVTFLYYEKPYKVVSYSLIKMGRGGATVKLMVRNMETGSSEPLSFSSNVKVDEVVTQKRRLQYLFKDGKVVTFMDPNSFDQIEIPVSIIENEIPFMKEGDNVDVLFWNDKALSVDIAPNVVLEVTETDPGVKGNTVSNLYKPAKLSNGLTIKVPLFINVGEKIRVDTRTSSYIERANK
ncbi:elongation factor P [soil metagenome]